MDDLSDIRDLYNAAWNVEDDRLARHQLEADITWRYLRQYLPPSGRLLEVGFGTGAYTFPLAKSGYQITAVDLADDLVTRCRGRADELGLSSQVEFVTGDARTLTGIPLSTFDAGLLMGPLYHLVLEPDRTAALRSAFSCLKPGGILISALLSRFGVLGDQLRKNPSWIESQEQVWSLVNHGHRPAGAPRGGFRGYFVRLDEVVPMHESAGFETLKVAGAEPVIGAHDEGYNNLEGEQRELWLDLLFAVSAEESMVASSRHIIYVGRRPWE